MAVRKLNQVGEGYNVRYERTGEVTHEGLVLEVGSEDVRVMSDVWAIGYYALAWNPTTQSPEKVGTGNCEFGRTAEADVDATPEVIAAHQMWKAERECKAREAEIRAIEERAKAHALVPRRGARARVVKGRKVPVGTEGVVIWTGSGSFGARVGIKDDDGTTHWTAESNVVRVVEKADDVTWVDFNAAEAAKRPVKGEGARVVSGPKVGSVGLCVYAREDRCGIATTSRMEGNRHADVVWAGVDEVERVGGPVVLPDGTPPAPVDMSGVPF